MNPYDLKRQESSNFLRAAMYSAATLKEMLQQGYDPNLKNPEDGRTALHYAAEANNVPAVVELCQHKKTKLHVEDHDGLTAFDVAMERGHSLAAFQIKHWTGIRKRKKCIIS